MAYIKLVRPKDAPNTCFIVLSQRICRLVKHGPQDWDYGQLLKKPQWPKPADPDYEHLSWFIQFDWDYPSTAQVFGWSVRSVKHKGKRCDHRGSDGTVDCKECGVTTSEFISAAYAFLCENIGKQVKA